MKEKGSGSEQLHLNKVDLIYAPPLSQETV